MCCPNWIQPPLVLIWPGPRPPGFLLLAFDLPERYHPHYTLPALARLSKVEASSLAARVHIDSTHHRRKSGPEERLLIRRPEIEHLYCQWLEMHLCNVFIYRLPTTHFPYLLDATRVEGHQCVPLSRRCSSSSHLISSPPLSSSRIHIKVKLDLL